jgi:hypothetical protein
VPRAHGANGKGGEIVHHVAKRAGLGLDGVEEGRPLLNLERIFDKGAGQAIRQFFRNGGTAPLERHRDRARQLIVPELGLSEKPLS